MTMMLFIYEVGYSEINIMIIYAIKLTGHQISKSFAYLPYPLFKVSNIMAIK